MVIIIKHEELSDKSLTPTVSIIDNDNHVTLHPVDDNSCNKLIDALYHFTIDINESIDYRWMDEK